jgi:selenide,water dikinase
MAGLGIPPGVAVKPTAGRLLLIGAGHAHLFVLEALARHRIHAGDVVLVSPHPLQVYSPMVPGYLEGRYSLDELCVHLPSATAALGARFIEGEAIRVDAAARTVTLEDGTALDYDVASVAIGGSPAGAATPGARQFAAFAKPAHLVPDLLARLEAAAQAAGPEPLQVVIVGAGALGVEVALTVRARLDRLGASRAIITLIDSTATVLRDRSIAAQEEAELTLKEREITLRLGVGVEEVGVDYLRITGRVLPADLVIWATGAEAPALFRESGLPTDARGFLTVDDTLAVPDCPGLFGAGDAVSMQSAPRTPKSVGDAVRQGPILARNLRAALEGTDPSARFRSSGRYMTLMNCGDGRAILSYSGFAATSGLSMKLKDRMDRAFVRRFRALNR